MIHPVIRSTVLKRTGERWQLGDEQLLVLDVRSDSVTLGLPASAGTLYRHSRRAPGARGAGPGLRSGYYWFPAGGPCMFVVNVRPWEPVAVSMGYSIVAEAIQGDGVQLTYGTFTDAA